MPWISCLALEWAIELTPNPKAKAASEQCVNRVLQMLWELQNSALELDSPDFAVQIRKMLVSQIRFQANKNSRFIFLFRFIAILSLQNGKQTLSQSFESQTGMSLEKFLNLSTWLLVHFTFKNNYFLKYETLINELYPANSVEDISHFLKMVGGTLPQLQISIQSVRPVTRLLYQSEYFEEPVLIARPVILFNDGISTSHSHVLSIGISEFVMRTLKAADPSSFKKTFTKLFETYIDRILTEFEIEFTTEKTIIQWYQKAGVNSKVVDFLIEDDSEILFIDAKAVEPKNDTLTSGSGSFIKDKLKDAHVKGVIQMAECAETLISIGKLNKPIQNRFGLVVTHQEFFISDTNTLLSYCEGSSIQLKENIKGKFLSNNIHFCTIADLDRALNICRDTNTSLIDFIRYCTIQQASSLTRRFTFDQHLEGYNVANGSASNNNSNSLIREQSDRFLMQCENSITDSVDYWQAFHPLKAQNFTYAFLALKSRLGL